MPLHAKALLPGDRVAVLSPAGPIRAADALDRGLARLREWGLEPVLMPHARDEEGYLASRDAARAEDLQSAIADPKVRGIFATRGGYGCTRILPRLDLAPLARDPKPIVGYSDLTALLAAAWKQVGLVGFHGPMVATLDSMAMGRECEALQRDLLTRGRAAVLPAADGEGVAHAIRRGQADGCLLGGNLAIVCALIGTPWQIDFAGALAFLEDTGEEPYRIDRMLTQLQQSGAFARATGVVLGDFHAQDTPLGSESAEMTAVLHERLGGLRIPVAYGFPFGHRPRAWTLPFGGMARLLCPELARPARLELLEPAVKA